MLNPGRFSVRQHQSREEHKDEDAGSCGEEEEIKEPTFKSMFLPSQTPGIVHGWDEMVEEPIVISDTKEICFRWAHLCFSAYERTPGFKRLLLVCHLFGSMLQGENALANPVK